MKYDRFEDLPVWKDAIDLKLLLDQFCEHPKVRRLRKFVDQMDGAGLSISNNIAEGFERGTTNELLAFLYIARGSAGEVRSMLRYAERRPDLVDLKSQISNLISKAESISRQLRGWADSLQNSDIKGQRHLTDSSREHYQQTMRARAFWEKLRSEHMARFAQQKSATPDTIPGELPQDSS